MDADDAFPPFQPPDRQDWHYVAYLVGWIVSLTRWQESGIEPTSKQVIQRRLAFLFELPTLLERRNETTRRILRILMDPSRSWSPVKDQTGEYWIDALGDDRASVSPSSATVDKNQELLDLCRQFGEVGIRG